jgi:hypothetical protein
LSSGKKGSATRELFESCLKKSKSISLAQFNICGELGSSEAIKEAVIAGWGVSVIFHSCRFTRIVPGIAL